MTVIVLAGGTGGAKLARGMLDGVGSDLVVIANTADDVEVHGAYVCPDPDLCLFWLADRIDERGWGLAGDTFEAMDALEDPWFRLGDEDLAIGRERAERLAAGERLTEIMDGLCGRFGVHASVLPMCDEPVRTWVDDVAFQEWMIRAGGKFGEKPLESIELRGVDDARITLEVAAALESARAVIIGPSNPVISIGPILAIPGMRALVRDCPAPVVAVSPFVGGAIVKGPTDPFLRAAWIEPTPAGVADAFGDLIDGFVADEEVPGLTTLVTDVLMDGAEGRARLAREALDFAIGFAP